MLKELFILSLLLHVVFCWVTPNDRQWNEEDARQNCTLICTKSCENCTKPITCGELEDKCPGNTDVHDDCPADENCVPAGCQCK